MATWVIAATVTAERGADAAKAANEALQWYVDEMERERVFGPTVKISAKGWIAPNGVTLSASIKK